MREGKPLKPCPKQEDTEIKKLPQKRAWVIKARAIGRYHEEGEPDLLKIGSVAIGREIANGPAALRKIRGVDGVAQEIAIKISHMTQSAKG